MSHGVAASDVLRRSLRSTSPPTLVRREAEHRCQALANHRVVVGDQNSD
jgi:hypothetical protein